MACRLIACEVARSKMRVSVIGPVGDEGNQHHIGVKESSPSQVAFEEAIQIDGIVPSGQQLDSVFHPAEPDLRAFLRGSGDLGYWFAVARDDNLFAPLNGVDELGEAVFGFGNTHLHGALL
jgi:hypothetical protein